jgi:ABC-type multidrug transport system fused ATPase/permease subunit
MFLVLGIVQFCGFFLQFSQFTISGEILTRRLRSLYFRSLLRQEAAFFDDEDNSPGTLTGRLATEATLVKGLAGELLGTLVSLTVTMIAGLTIAFVASWQVTLMVLAMVPVLVAAGVVQGRLLLGATGASKARYLKASNIASEAVSQIRTVQILGKEKMFMDAYKADLIPAHQAVIRGTVANAAAVAFSQLAFFLGWVLAYGACVIFISNGTVTSEQAQNATFAVIFTALQLGQGSSFAPNIVKAKIAALQIFDQLDRVPAIPDPMTTGGQTAPPVGSWEMDQVQFTYPTRPDQMVLRGIDLRGPPGRTIALVGASGSGKSTVIALLERFYDINGGSAKIEGVEIRDWDLNKMRSEISLVSQEPILFSGSIRDNIAYGIPDDQPPATIEQIEAAAAQANCLGFVKALPQGFDTPVGEKGALLSGGQKQRVAIARALVRDPKILLLDEATSALDSESEKVVQLALDNAAKGRTTVTIAHRLSTIQNASFIYVFQRGVVVEQGTHFDLIAKKGTYFQLVTEQSLNAH